MSDTVVNGVVDQATYPEGNLAHHPVERTGYPRVGVVVAGIYQLGLGLSQLSLGRRIGVFGHLQVIFADDVATLQFAFVLGRQASRLGIGASYLNIGLGYLQSGFVGDRIDNKKDLTFSYDRSLVHSQLGNKAAHIRPYLNIPFTFDGGRIVTIPLH